MPFKLPNALDLLSILTLKSTLSFNDANVSLLQSQIFLRSISFALCWIASSLSFAFAATYTEEGREDRRHPNSVFARVNLSLPFDYLSNLQDLPPDRYTCFSHTVVTLFLFCNFFYYLRSPRQIQNTGMPMRLEIGSIYWASLSFF